jgi:hypothetical protein
MDEATYLLLLLILMTGTLIFLLWKGKLDLNITGEEMHERIDGLEEALKVVGTVLERLPELVPQFSINQNPFQSLIDAFAERMKANMDTPSYAEGALRDPEGRFTDGAEKEEATSE